MNDEWVKLPKGSQITLSRDQIRSMQGMGVRGKALIAILIVCLFWLISHSSQDQPKTTHPHPQTSISVPAKEAVRR
jgi:hypothetical protein